MTPHFKIALVLGAVFALALLAGCAAPAGTMIPPEVLAACKAEGGCVMFSRRRLEQVLQEAVEQTCRGSV